MSTETDPIKLELMKHVERAVRPVVARIGTKMRMRRELLGHLVETFEQELTRLGDTQAAAGAAMARLGGPADLTPKLQRTVPRFERWEGRSGERTRRREGESVLKHALRQAWEMALPIVVLMVPLCIAIGIKSVIAPSARDLPFMSVTLPLVLVMVVGYFIGTFLFVVLGQAVVRICTREKNRWRWPMAMLVAIPTGPIAYLIAAAWVLAIIHQPKLFSVEIQFLGSVMGGFAWLWALPAVVPPIFLGVTALIVRENRSLAPWSALNIDDRPGCHG